MFTVRVCDCSYGAAPRERCDGRGGGDGRGGRAGTPRIGRVAPVRFDCAPCCDPDARPGGADAPPERAKPDWRRRKNAAFWNPQAPLAGAREAELLINPP